MKTLQLIPGVMALSLAFLGSARATTVFVQFDAAYSSPITVDRTVDAGANWYAQDPGQFHFFTLSGPPGVPPAFYTFCIEPREFLTPGQQVTYNLVPLDQGTTNIGGMGIAKANTVREFLYRYYPDLSVQVDTTTAAAIQVALWEIIRENTQHVGTYDLATGDVQYRNWNNTAVRDLAQSMLNGLTGSGPYVNNVSAGALVGVQDILIDPTAGGQGVPEPGTFLLSGGALLLAGLTGRRYRRRP